MKEKTVCLSGHRNIPEEKYEEIQSQLLHILSGLIQKGYRFFGTGGALGFDTMAPRPYWH